MKILYLDLGMGAAGDMLSAALLELIPDKEAFVNKLNSLGIPGVKYETETVTKCGINGTYMRVLVNGEEEVCADHHSHEHIHEHSHEHGHEHGHHHSTMHDIEHIIYDHIDMPDNVKKDVIEVYRLIAEAEGHAHGKPVSEIHFHEVGTMDAVADITAVCLLMNELAPDKVYASPVHVGSGHVHCAHGILPVPAPATEFILRDIPVYGGKIEGELCTPTGAALLKHFVTNFGEMPVMCITAAGYGMGRKDFPIVNCVRALMGESEDEKDDIYELSCNVDDMTGEKIGFAVERLFAAGAMDVYTVPIGMKKSRPGLLIRVICHEDQREIMVRAIFKYTTTIGIREQKMHRYILHRDIEAIETEYGRIRKKTSTGYGVERTKLEYDDIAGAALQEECSLTDMEGKLTQYML